MTKVDGEVAKMKKKKKSRKRPAESHRFELKAAVEQPADASFSDFALDEQLLKAIGELGWERPTLVQSQMIPLAFENKNILARARTGSGKTAAYMLPILQKVLQIKCNVSDKKHHGPFAFFVVPSKELAKQTFTLLQHLTSKFPFLLVMDFAELKINEEDNWLEEHPDIVVSTPSRLLEALKKYKNVCKSIKHIVLDEADLLLSYGYADEMRQIKNYLPKFHQTIFTSATMTENVSALKEIYMTGDVVSLKLKEGQLPAANQLSQYHVQCRSDEERFSIFISLLKLNLINGKTIIFVKDTDRCYQLSLFMQTFGVRSCILNCQMPVSSRCHVVEEFNEDKYFYVIASDINDLVNSNEDENHVEDDSAEKPAKRVKTSKKSKHFDKESGVSRGIDFHHVANVINFDFPTSVDSYIHRVGRTARGWNKGTALSFVSDKEKQYLEQVQQEISLQEGHMAIVPYEVRIKELDSFVLRAREALAACTRSAVREARLAEIRAEILRSKRLETYFAKNPREKAVLEHDKKLFTVSVHNPAFKDVPEYMVPASLRGLVGPAPKAGNKKKRKHKPTVRKTLNQVKYEEKISDPLQSFSL